MPQALLFLVKHAFLDFWTCMAGSQLAISLKLSLPALPRNLAIAIFPLAESILLTPCLSDEGLHFIRRATRLLPTCVTTLQHYKLPK